MCKRAIQCVEYWNTTCAPGSLTLCDFFQNRAGSFVLGRNWAALTSLARTDFEVHGKQADVYFECHYFDVATAAKMSDVLLDSNPGSQITRIVSPLTKDVSYRAQVRVKGRPPPESKTLGSDRPRRPQFPSVRNALILLSSPKGFEPLLPP
jgi:hypothetical protein